MNHQSEGRTVGYWHVYNKPLRPQLSKVRIIEIQDRNGVAVVGWPGFDHCDQTAKKKLANARAMATAPEMIDALKAAEEFIESVDPKSFTVIQVRAALSKTVGEV